MNKKVSIVIPAYNKAEYTIKTVESVLAQTYDNIEIIVVYDGSVDDTSQKLESYKDRIKYVWKENGGACSARNMGIGLAKGDYIGILDCDDLYLPEKVEKSIKYLEENTDVGFLSTAAYLIDENDNVKNKHSMGKGRAEGWIARKLLEGNFICNSTVIVKKRCFDSVGMFDESIFVPADWDMWLRLAEKFKAGYIGSPLSMYRTSGSYLIRHLEKSKEEELVVLNKAFKRDTEINDAFKNKVLSNVYCRYSLNYLSEGDMDKTQKFLYKALKKNRFNVKAIILLLSVRVLGRLSCYIHKKIRK